MIAQAKTNKTDLRGGEKLKDILTVEEATEKLRSLGMRISPTTLRSGMEQGRFPFGDFIKTDKSCVCYVYTRLLERWVEERFGPEAIRSSA